MNVANERESKEMEVKCVFFNIFDQSFSVLRDSCCFCECKCGCKPVSTESSVRSGGSGSGAANGSKTASTPSS